MLFTTLFGKIYTEPVKIFVEFILGPCFSRTPPLIAGTLAGFYVTGPTLLKTIEC